MEPPVGELASGAIRGPAGRVDFPVGFDDGKLVVDFAHAEAEIADQFLECLQLFFGGLVSVEVAYQTDPEGDIVEVITVYMAPIDLTMPPVANLNFAVS